MTAGKQKKTPVIVIKKKRHVITASLTEEQVTSSAPSEILPGPVESSSPAHQTKKNKKWTPEFINTSLEKVKALFPLLRAEEGGGPSTENWYHQGCYRLYCTEPRRRFNPPGMAVCCPDYHPQVEIP